MYNDCHYFEDYYNNDNIYYFHNINNNNRNDTNNSFNFSIEISSTSKKATTNFTKNETKNKENTHKYNDPYLRKRCKRILLDCLLKFINNKIRELYNGIIGDGISKKELKILNYKANSDISIKKNKEFLYKPIGDIFSDTITTRITTLFQSHNHDLIKNLLNEKDIEKNDYFNRLFNLKFSECLDHFIGKEWHEELNGMEQMNDVIKDFLDENYLENIKYYFNNYETIINKKREKKSGNKKKNKMNNIENYHII